MRFDHLMHWVPDLEAAIARCTELGFLADRVRDVVGLAA
jgi:hypothetical protein